VTTFSPTEAALVGVRLSRERPRAVFLWALWFCLFPIFLSLIAALLLGGKSRELLEAARLSPNDPAEFDKLLGKLWLYVAVAYPLWLVFQSAFTAAVYRCVLAAAHEEKRLYLTLGRDEMRLFALNLINGAIIAGFLFVAFFIVLIAGVGAAEVAGALGTIAFVALVGAAIYVGVRLSLAGPATCAQGRLVVFESWSMTQGHFWRLLGAYLLAMFLAVIVFLALLVGFVVILGVMLGLTHLRMADINEFPPKPKALLIWPIAQIGASLVIVCFKMIVVAPAAEAYREIAASEA
jgi:hypothetical protein